jgi:RNA polymerase sigma-B factor
LPERQRTVLTLRFFENLTQTEIAERIGCSQMHVSRLLAKALDTLRRQARRPELAVTG